MTFYFVASDTELDGSFDQTVSASYCGECKWFILGSEADLSAYEFDAYESYLEDDSFQDFLVAEFTTDPSPFTLGSLQKLHLGVVDDSGNIVWQCKASELPPHSIIKRSLEPEDIDWPSVPGGRPASGFLIRFTGFEEDGPELPLLEFDDDPGSAEQVKVICSDRLDGMSADEVCGLIWKGKTIDIYGTGGAGYTPEYEFYRIDEGNFNRLDIGNVQQVNRIQPARDWILFSGFTDDTEGCLSKICKIYDLISDEYRRLDPPEFTGYKRVPWYKTLEEFQSDALKMAGVRITRDELLQSKDEILSGARAGIDLWENLAREVVRIETFELSISLKNYSFKYPYHVENFENTLRDAARHIMLTLEVKGSESVEIFKSEIDRIIHEDIKRLGKETIENNTRKNMLNKLRVELFEPQSSDPNLKAFKILVEQGRTSIKSLRLHIDYPDHSECCNQSYEEMEPYKEDPRPLNGKELLDKMEELKDKSKKDQAIGCGYYYIYDDGTKQADLPGWAEAKKDALK